MCDGHIVYQGSAKTSADYFKKIGYSIGSQENPPDVFMRILSVNYPKEAEDEKLIAKFMEQYKKNLE